MATRPVLVTGFEPYGGRGLNPAYETMQALNGRIIEGVPVVGRGLPVSFSGLKSAIANLLDEFDPVAVVNLGLWPGETMVRIERVSVNIADFEIADNEPLIITDGEVTRNGQTARVATLPLRAIERALLEAGIPARLSATAGTFLCNSCLYAFLEAVERRPHQTLCGFLHLPYMPQQVAALLTRLRIEKQLELHQRADFASMELSRMVSGVEIAVRETVRAIAA
jgi:pyroglutamyl-peptidase